MTKNTIIWLIRAALIALFGFVALLIYLVVAFVDPIPGTIAALLFFGLTSWVTIVATSDDPDDPPHEMNRRQAQH